MELTLSGGVIYLSTVFMASNGLCSQEFLCSSFLHDEAYVKTKNTRLSDVTTDGTTHSNNNFQEAKEDQSTVQ